MAKSKTTASYNGGQGGKNAAGPASGTPQKPEATALSTFALKSSDSTKKGGPTLSVDSGKCGGCKK